MLTYYLFMLITFIFGLSLKKFEGGAATALYIIYILMFIFIFGFRFEVGVDWFSYERNHIIYVSNIVNYLSGIANLDVREIGFRLLNYISFQFGTGYQGLIFISTVIFISSSIYAVSRMKINPYYFLVMTFPFHVVMSAMNLTKQSLALSISLLAFSFLLERRRLLFVFWIIVAAMFHTSALIFIAYIFIDNRKRYLILFSVLLFPLYILMVARYEQYFDSGLSSVGIFLRLAMVFVLLVSIFIYRNQWLSYGLHLKRIYASMYAMFVAIILISLISSTMGDRLSYYLILFSSVLWLKINDVTNKTYIILTVCCYLSSVILFVFWASNTSFIDEYSFKWLFFKY